MKHLNKSVGFTLIELMIVLVMCALIGIPIIARVAFSDGNNYTYGANGLTETRCINGLLFVVGQSGSVQQMIGESGGGISCK